MLISRSDSFIDNDDREYFAMAYAWISGSTPNTAKTSVEGEPVEAFSADATGSATDATGSATDARSVRAVPGTGGSRTGRR